MRYLVTGGLGVVGSLLCRELVKAGDVVDVIDACEEPRNHWMAEELLRAPGVRSIRRRRLERMSHEELADVLASVDRVIHAAAHTGIPHSAEDPGDDWASNVDATRALLEALRVCDRKIPSVVMSSVKPYRTVSMEDVVIDEGGTSYRCRQEQLFHGIDEGVVLEPDEPYAASKMAQSALALAYARTYELPIACLRFSNLYGPAPCHGPRHGWLTWFAISRALGLAVQVQGTGLQVRDMLYSSDINAALLAALDHIDATAGKVFNVGGGMPNALSVREAVDILDFPSTHRLRAPGRKNEDPIFVTDHSKFSEATGWSPKVGVREGAERIVEWARENEAKLREVYGYLWRRS